VLVTGGAGVIGTELIRILVEHGARVLCSDLKPRPENLDAGVAYIQGDANLLTREQIEDFGPELCFHLAATFERSFESEEFWEENYWHNIRLSHHLATLLKSSDTLKRIVFASSYLIYDPGLYQFPTPPAEPTILNEDAAIYPRNICGAAKLLHELELRFLGAFDSCPASSVSARIFRVYGRGSRDIVSRWVRTLVGEPNAELEIYRKEGRFDYIYAGEVAQGLVLLGASDATGIVNLGRGRSRSVADLVGILRGRFPGLGVVEVPSDIPIESHCADMSGFEEATGWRPEIDLEAGIDILIEHEREQTTLNDHRASPFEEPTAMLVSSASAKVPLIRRARDVLGKSTPPGSVWAGDSDPSCVARYFADGFWLMPSIDELGVDELVDSCRARSIVMIVPTRDGELAFFAEHRAALENAGIFVGIGSADGVNDSLDKLAFFNRCSKAAIPSIPTFRSFPELTSALPDCSSYVVKERHGAGSRTLGIDLDHPEVESHAAGLDEPIFQPMVSGTEHSVDIYVNREGEVVEAIPRVRRLVRHGESVITETVEAPELIRRSIELSEEFGLRGHAVLQAFVDDEGRPIFIECNPRVGGASALSMEAGLDTLGWSILEARGGRVEPRIGHYRRGLKMVRYPSDRFIAG
jgi:carbamoyl-phosphate synthase large subunit